MPKVSYATNRKTARRPIRLALILIMDSDSGEVRDEGYTVDVSEVGCRVEGVDVISEGQLVRVLPLNSTMGEVAGRVVWVGKPKSKLAGEAGIEFLQPLPSMV